MEDILSRLWENLVGRVDRPMALRLLLQPAMAIYFGIRDGLRFAREGRSFLLLGRLTPHLRLAKAHHCARGNGEAHLTELEMRMIGYTLNGATLCPTIRKPFDVLVEGLDLKISGGGGNRTFG